MSTNTTWLKLTKPSEDEKYDIGVFNSNADILDRRILSAESQIQSLSESLRNPMSEYDLEKKEEVEVQGQCNISANGFIQLNLHCIWLPSPVTSEPQTVIQLNDITSPYGGPILLPCFLYNCPDDMYNTEHGFAKLDWDGIEVWKSPSCTRDDLYCIGLYAFYRSAGF